MSSNSKADEDKTAAAVAFKPIKKRSRQKNFRSRRDNNSDDEEDETGKRVKTDNEEEEEEEFNLDKMEETKELQKLRQRSKGVSHVTLASGVKMSKVEEEVGVDASDPFKLKTGGLLDLARAKQAKALEDPSSNEKYVIFMCIVYPYCSFGKIILYGKLFLAYFSKLCF